MTDWWFSPGTPVSSTNKTDCHDLAEIVLKVVLNTITPNPFYVIGVFEQNGKFFTSHYYSSDVLEPHFKILEKKYPNLKKFKNKSFNYVCRDGSFISKMLFKEDLSTEQ